MSCDSIGKVCCETLSSVGYHYGCKTEYNCVYHPHEDHQGTIVAQTECLRDNLGYPNDNYFNRPQCDCRSNMDCQISHGENSYCNFGAGNQNCVVGDYVMGQGSGECYCTGVAPVCQPQGTGYTARTGVCVDGNLIPNNPDIPCGFSQTQTCNDNQFDCHGDGTECIPLPNVCDGYVDCSNGADELAIDGGIQPEGWCGGGVDPGLEDLVQCYGNPTCSCLDPEALNYLFNSVNQDGTCSDGGFYTPICSANPQACQDVCCQYPVLGCTDQAACNYYVGANEDDGSCTYVGVDYVNECGCLADDDNDGICDQWEEGFDGFIDECVGEYDECGVCNGPGIPPGACDCDGNVLDCFGECGGGATIGPCGVCCYTSNMASCYPVTCWDNSLACNEWDCPPELNEDGCTDTEAINFHNLAGYDDGSCIYAYCANISDGTCADYCSSLGNLAGADGYIECNNSINTCLDGPTPDTSTNYCFYGGLGYDHHGQVGDHHSYAYQGAYQAFVNQGGHPSLSSCLSDSNCEFCVENDFTWNEGQGLKCDLTNAEWFCGMMGHPSGALSNPLCSGLDYTTMCYSSMGDCLRYAGAAPLQADWTGYSYNSTNGWTKMITCDGNPVSTYPCGTEPEYTNCWGEQQPEGTYLSEWGSFEDCSWCMLDGGLDSMCDFPLDCCGVCGGDIDGCDNLPNSNNYFADFCTCHSDCAPGEYCDGNTETVSSTGKKGCRPCCFTSWGSNYCPCVEWEDSSNNTWHSYEDSCGYLPGGCKDGSGCQHCREWAGDDDYSHCNLTGGNDQDCCVSICAASAAAGFDVPGFGDKMTTVYPENMAEDTTIGSPDQWNDAAISQDPSRDTTHIITLTDCQGMSGGGTDYWMTTCGGGQEATNFDTVLSIYDMNGVKIHSVDDGCPESFYNANCYDPGNNQSNNPANYDNESCLYINVQHGNTGGQCVDRQYYLVVSGWGGQVGDYFVGISSQDWGHVDNPDPPDPGNGSGGMTPIGNTTIGGVTDQGVVPENTGTCECATPSGAASQSGWCTVQTDNCLPGYPPQCSPDNLYDPAGNPTGQQCGGCNCGPTDSGGEVRSGGKGNKLNQKVKKSNFTMISSRNRIKPIPKPASVQKFDKPIISDRGVDNPPITINTTRTDCCCEPLIYDCENVGLCGGNTDATTEPYNQYYYNTSNCGGTNGTEYFEDCDGDGIPDLNRSCGIVCAGDSVPEMCGRPCIPQGTSNCRVYHHDILNPLNEYCSPGGALHGLTRYDWWWTNDGVDLTNFPNGYPSSWNTGNGPGVRQYCDGYGCPGGCDEACDLVCQADGATSLANTDGHCRIEADWMLPYMHCGINDNYMCSEQVWPCPADVSNGYALSNAPFDTFTSCLGCDEEGNVADMGDDCLYDESTGEYSGECSIGPCSPYSKYKWGETHPNSSGGIPRERPHYIKWLLTEGNQSNNGMDYLWDWYPHQNDYIGGTCDCVCGGCPLGSVQDTDIDCPTNTTDEMTGECCGGHGNAGGDIFYSLPPCGPSQRLCSSDWCGDQASSFEMGVCINNADCAFDVNACGECDGSECAEYLGPGNGNLDYWMEDNCDPEPPFVQNNAYGGSCCGRCNEVTTVYKDNFNDYEFPDDLRCWFEASVWSEDSGWIESHDGCDCWNINLVPNSSVGRIPQLDFCGDSDYCNRGIFSLGYGKCETGTYLGPWGDQEDKCDIYGGGGGIYDYAGSINGDEDFFYMLTYQEAVNYCGGNTQGDNYGKCCYDYFYQDCSTGVCEYWWQGSTCTNAVKDWRPLLKCSSNTNSCGCNDGSTYLANIKEYALPILDAWQDKYYNECD